MIEADDWEGLSKHHGHKCTVTRTPDGVQVICVDCGSVMVQVADVRAVVEGCLPLMGKTWVDGALDELIDELAVDVSERVRNAPVRDKLAWLARRTELAEWLADLEEGG